jgi:hypothetical protein
VARVGYAPDTTLAGADADFLVGALTGWIGDPVTPFALMADGTGLRGADAAYRSKLSGFFQLHRDTARIALINMGPILHVVGEMFRVGTGIQLEELASEDLARAWLRTKGIAA